MELNGDFNVAVREIARDSKFSDWWNEARFLRGLSVVLLKFKERWSSFAVVFFCSREQGFLSKAFFRDSE